MKGLNKRETCREKRNVGPGEPDDQPQKYRNPGDMDARGADFDSMI